MNDFANNHPLLFLAALFVAMVFVGKIQERLNILLRGYPPPKPPAPTPVMVDFKPVEKRLDGIEANMRRMVKVLEIALGPLAKSMGQPPPSGDPLDRFQRDISGLSAKERAAMMSKAREWMFGDTKAEKSTK